MVSVEEVITSSISPIGHRMYAKFRTSGHRIKISFCINGTNSHLHILPIINGFTKIDFHKIIGYANSYTATMLPEIGMVFMLTSDSEIWGDAFKEHFRDSSIIQDLIGISVCRLKEGDDGR